MKTRFAFLYLLISLCAAVTSRAAVGTQPPGSGGSGSGGSLTGSVWFPGPFTVSGTNWYLNAGISNIAVTGVSEFATNRTLVPSIFTNTVYVNARGANQAANGLLLTNALATAPAFCRIVVGPGDYFVAEVANPSPSFATDNRWIDFQPGANWRAGSTSSAAFFMFDDDLAKVTNVWVTGRGNFFQTNIAGSSGNLLQLGQGSTVYFEHQNAYLTNADSMFNVAGVGNNTLNWITHGKATTMTYDNAYFTMSATNKVRAWFHEIETVGDVFELGGNAVEWGDVIVGYNTAKAINGLSGQSSVMQVGGKAIVKNGTLKVERTSASIYGADNTTNGLIEGGIIIMPANGSRSVLQDNSDGSGNPFNGNTALWLKNVSIYGATNVDAFTLTNGTTYETILENVTVHTGFASTNLIRAATPSKVRIVGGLDVRPYKPFGSGISIVGTNIAPAIRNVGTLVNHGEAFFSNAVSVVGNIASSATVSGVDVTASGDINGLTLSASGSIGTPALNIGNPTPTSILMVNANGDVTNATLSGASVSGTTLTIVGGSNYITLATGSLTVTGAVSQIGDGTIPAEHQLFGTNNIVYVFKAANSNSVSVTNVVGLLHKAYASVVVLDCNHGSRFAFTNRAATGNTTLVLTNLAQGQEINISMLGESAANNRTVTVVPQLGYLVSDLDAFGVAVALNKSFTLTNNNGVEISALATWEIGTNWCNVVTRQYQR